MHCTFLTVALALVGVAVAGQTYQIKSGFWTRVKGNVMCRGRYLETRAVLKTAQNPSQEIVGVFTHYGHFDMLSHAHNGGILSPLLLPPVSPGFVVSIKADCRCGGEWFDLLVPAANQYHHTPLYAEHNPYDYGTIELSNCTARKSPHT